MGHRPPSLTQGKPMQDLVATRAMPGEQPPVAGLCPPPTRRLELRHDGADCLVVAIHRIGGLVLAAGVLPGLVLLAGLVWLLTHGAGPDTAGLGLLVLAGIWLLPPTAGLVALMGHFRQEELLVLRRGEISQERRGWGRVHTNNWRVGNVLESTLGHQWGGGLALYADGDDRIELGLLLRRSEHDWLCDRVLERVNP